MREGVKGSNREAGRVDDLCAVGAFHQEEAGVARVILVGLLAHLAHRRQGKAGLHGAREDTVTTPLQPIIHAMVTVIHAMVTVIHSHTCCAS